MIRHGIARDRVVPWRAAVLNENLETVIAMHVEGILLPENGIECNGERGYCDKASVPEVK